jgi:antitoxin component YwqK of YwqJK toxin-antitoxin module
LECFYDSLGRKERSITYKSDVKEGPASEYFPTGGVRTSFNYTNNLIEGKYLEYAEEFKE